MIRTENLTKTYGDKTALRDLTLNVETGEIFCLLGSNGAGKSTTLNLLLNFIQPDSGQIIIDEQPIDPKSNQSAAIARQKIAYLPEQVNLYQQFNSIENVRYLCELSGVKTTTVDIEYALEQTGLDQQMWLKPLKDYSKGMRQKVGIAFAIIRKAKILLLDEPTSGLDPSATDEFINIIKKLADNGAAVLMVTHDLYCAEKLANKMAILKQGHVVDAFDNQGLMSGAIATRYQQAMNQNVDTIDEYKTQLKIA